MDVLSVTDVHSVVTSLMYFRLPPAQKPSLLYSTVGGAIGQIIPIPSLSVSQMAVRLQRRVEEVLNGNEPVEGSLVPSYVPTGLETLRRDLCSQYANLRESTQKRIQEECGMTDDEIRKLLWFHRNDS